MTYYPDPAWMKGDGLEHSTEEDESSEYERAIEDAIATIKNIDADNYDMIWKRIAVRELEQLIGK